MRKSGREIRVSRRAFGRLLAASPLAATPAAPQAASREEELKAANRRRQSNAETLAKFKLPMATEPSFIFKP